MHTTVEGFALAGWSLEDLEGRLPGRALDVVQDIARRFPSLKAFWKFDGHEGGGKGFGETRYPTGSMFKV
jgi:hypothetical protein